MHWSRDAGEIAHNAAILYASGNFASILDAIEASEKIYDLALKRQLQQDPA